MKFQLFIVSCIFLVILLIIYYFNRNNGIYVKSHFDNDYYLVAEGKNKQKFADTLASLKINTKKLVKFMKNPKNTSPEMLVYVNRLANKLKSMAFDQNLSDKYTAYMINKEDLVMCITSKTDGSIHDINLLMYVIAHEMSHAMVLKYDNHGPEFKKVFKFVTESAVKAGLFKPINFEINPVEYCGLTINSNILN